MTNPRHLVRAPAVQDALRIKHPKNDASELFMTRLSDRAKMVRCGVNLARVPPGREAFVPHYHLHLEEWVYVLSGSGAALVGGATLEIGAGDFLGFPCDGTVHHITNIGDEDLVYLQGGERGPDVAVFPTLGRVGIPTLTEGHMALVDDSAIERLPLDAWLADDE